MAENWIISQEIDLQRGVQAPQVWANALIVCGDSKAHTWRVTIMDGGKPANLSGIVTGYFVRGDNATVKVSGTLTGNVASVTLDESCYNVEGDIVAVMRIRTSAGRITLAALIFSVRRIITDTIVDPENVIPSLDDLLAQIERMESSTQAADTATATANAAATNANAAAAAANAAAEEAGMSSTTADEAAERAEAAAEVVEGLTVSGHDVAYDQPATAIVTNVDGHKHISFGLRQGIPGAVPTITFTAKTGEPGTEVQIEQSGTPDAPTVTMTIPRGDSGEGSVSSVDGLMPGTGGDLALGAVRYEQQALLDVQKQQARENIGALGSDDVANDLGVVDAGKVLDARQGRELNERISDKASTASYTATFTAAGWSASAPYTQTVNVAGMLATDDPFVDVSLSGASGTEATDRLEAWTCVGRVTANAGSVTAYCYDEKPTVNLPVILKAVR